MLENTVLSKLFTKISKLIRGTRVKLFILFFLFLLLPIVNVLAKEYEISNYDVEMNLSEEGDFIIEERITFSFIEGDFSYAYREIEGNVFTDLEFLGIEGVNTSINDYDLKEGRDLNIKWYYDYLGDKATFLFHYKGIAGLQSIEGRNVVNWTPTGAEWEVPIRDIDVYINLPWELEDLEIEPADELAAQDSERLHFHSDFLAAGEAYKLYLSFPEMVNMTDKKGMGNAGSKWQTTDILLVIIITLAGLILSIIDILKRDKITAAEGKHSLQDLRIFEKAVLYHGLYESKKGITAQVFRLAKEGKIKLISSIKKGVLGSKQAEVSVEVVDMENLSEVEKEIVNGLKKHETLKEFSQDYKWFSRMGKIIKDLFRKKGFISTEMEFYRNRIYLSSILFILPSIAAFIAGGIYNIPIVIGIGISLFILCIARLIKGGIVTIFTAEALYLKELTASEIKGKVEELSKLIKEGKNRKALGYFFSELEFIILQKNFHSGVLNLYKKSFKKADDVELPVWLELDISELDTTLDGLEIVEVIDYLMMSMIIVASSTGTTTATGAGGGTAGGGGGGAG